MTPALSLLLCAVLAAPGDAAKTAGELPAAKPVPAVQVLPLPDDQAAFMFRGQELTRYHFGQTLRRPFNYPILGPVGRSLTRMGHPHDPIKHSHHNSVWISHMDAAGVNFWEDQGDNAGRIVCQRIEKYADGNQSAWLLGVNAWQDNKGQTLLLERRRIEVVPHATDDWLLLVDLQLEAPGNAPVTLGATPFGVIGVRMAKTIGVNDGGGRILNSVGQVNEKEVFRKPARWVDYSGPVTNEQRGGITLMDHPTNAGHPTPFHVRNDGWMGACLTLNGPRVVAPGKPLRLCYGLWNHAGVPTAAEIEPHWAAFAKRPLPKMTKDR